MRRSVAGGFFTHGYIDQTNAYFDTYGGRVVDPVDDHGGPR